MATTRVISQPAAGQAGVRITQRGQLALRPGNALNKLSKDAIAAIRTRTAKGISLLGRSFAKYTPRYADKRARMGKQVRPPNLDFSGEMLAGLYERGRGIDAKRATIVIGIRGRHAHVALFIHNGTRYMKARPFMGLTRAEHKALVPSIFDKVLVLL